ncbi:MAG: lipoyl-dependent peroxiredoxin [Thermomicrobiales bacterium]|jgi:osmotically inducible protein OsmC|nr:lipoyl-dependent peroxiredoxin [Thermomicrobiales bacterium]MEA2583540.1 lipoyl-dependent peroxiredoxin [Thermomicrobiales bacterium]MEA2597719.1 lipoyl-dependent peroxiredoxin [Thermomicrobiales bacterium]
MAERTATAVWQGGLTDGSGSFDVGSGALPNQPVTWASRTEDPAGRTSPEELIAAAHASCYAMAFSYTLQNAGHPAERLEVTSQVGFGPKPSGGMQVTHSNLTVRGRVPGLDQAQFADLARQGEQGCPVSNALRNNVEINLDATLES